MQTIWAGHGRRGPGRRVLGAGALGFLVLAGCLHFESGIRTLAFSADGRTVAIGCYGGTVHVWDPERDDETVLSVPPEGGVWSLAFSPDGSLLVVGGGLVATVWDVASWRCVATLPFPDPFAALAFSPDGRFLAGGGEGAFAIWGADAWTVLHHVTGCAWITALAFSPDGCRLAVSGGTTSSGPEATLWDPRAASVVRHLGGPFGGWYSLRFSADGSRLVGGEAAAVLVWDVGGVQPTTYQQLPLGDWDDFLGIDVSPDGSRAATMGGRRNVPGAASTVYVWQLAPVERMGQFNLDFFADVVAFSRDGSLLAVGGLDRVQIIEVHTGRVVAEHP